MSLCSHTTFQGVRLSLIIVQKSKSFLEYNGVTGLDAYHVGASAAEDRCLDEAASYRVFDPFRIERVSGAESRRHKVIVYNHRNSGSP